MKDIISFINESNLGEWMIINKSGIKGNKKYENLAKQAGVKYKGEYWFVSAGNISEVEAKDAYKEICNRGSDYSQNFACCKISDLEENNTKFK